MHASVAEEMAWRRGLYARILSYCHKGNFSFQRFMALRVDRLRLATGPSADRVQIPVGFSAGPSEKLRIALGATPTKSAPADPRALRRTLRFAQLHSHLDPHHLGGWLAEYGDSFLTIIGRLYARGFEQLEIGEGGDETAYLVHLSVLQQFRAHLEDADEARRALVATLIDTAVRATVDKHSQHAAPPSARLGFQFAAACNPISLGATATQIANVPLNPYRTHAFALKLAQRVLRGPDPAVDVAELRKVLSERMQADPVARRILVADAYLEMIRDAAMLLLAQACPDSIPPALLPLRDLTRNGRDLSRVLTNETHRKRACDVLEHPSLASSKVRGPLARLLSLAPAAFDGDASQLPKQADVRARSELAADGAIALALDSATAECVATIAGRIELVPADEVDAAHSEGRCYLLTDEDRPLFHLPPKVEEAVLHIDVSDLLEHVLSLNRGSPLDGLRHTFFEPLLRLVRTLAGPDSDRIEIVRHTVDALAFRGDVVALFELAQRALQLGRIEDEVSDALGGRASSLDDIDVRLDSIERRSKEIERELRRLFDEDPAAGLLRHEREELAREADDLMKNARARKVHTTGRAVAVGAFLDWGPKAEVGDGLVLSPPLYVAQRATLRSTRIAAERDRMGAHDQRTDSTVERVWPYGVAVRAFADHGQTRTEIFNAGCALSDDALEALRRDRGAVLRFDEISLTTIDLPDSVQHRFITEGVQEQFVVVRRVDEDTAVHLLHYAGDFRVPAVMESPTRVWEVLPMDSAFTAAVLDHIGGADA